MFLFFIGIITIGAIMISSIVGNPIILTSIIILIPIIIALIGWVSDYITVATSSELVRTFTSITSLFIIAILCFVFIVTLLHFIGYHGDMNFTPAL